jgi:glycosyltransferase involved in cell wall biosynthesis
VTGVLVVADAPGHILDRLSQAWIAHTSSGRAHELVYSQSTHPYQLRRRGERAGLIFWVDPLAFAPHPRAARTPQCVMVHHLTDAEIAPFGERLPFADAVATSSVRWQRRLAERFGIEATLVPYVIDTRVFHPADGNTARRGLGIGDDAYLIGFSAKALADAFGRKGIDLFVETIGAAAAEWRDLAVLLIGSGWEALGKQIESMGVRVVRREPRRTEDTAPLYPAMDVFLCTSREEGGPCTIMEAMACDVPAITTDVGHVPEVVEDGVNGFVVRERSAREFVERIRSLRGDAALRARIARAGRDFIVARRDERTVVPSIPFEAMYRRAEERFRNRGSIDGAARGASLLYLAGRFAVRRLSDSIRRSA